jgi:hypothetical protein
VPVGGDFAVLLNFRLRTMTLPSLIHCTFVS